jgi:hypothetical protein
LFVCGYFTSSPHYPEGGIYGGISPPALSCFNLLITFKSAVVKLIGVSLFPGHYEQPQSIPLKLNPVKNPALPECFFTRPGICSRFVLQVTA